METSIQIAFVLGGVVGVAAGLGLYALSNFAVEYYRRHRRYRNMTHNQYNHQSGNALNDN